MRAHLGGRQIGNILADLFFPISCLGCGQEEGVWLCTHCIGKLVPLAIHGCLQCGSPEVYGSLCRPCLTRLHLACYFAGYSYTSPLIQEIISALKYQSLRSCASVIADISFASLVAPVYAYGTPTIVPIPLHERRFRERGYNQSALIAQALAHHLQLPYADILIRTRSTAQQAHLLRDDRAENVRAAFSLKQEERMPACVLLVDDVLTTGATMAEAARILTNAGVTVIGFSFAHG